MAVASSTDGKAVKYYLQYDGDEQNGEWTEIVAPGTEYALDADTMPQALVNTDVNTFTVGNATWGDRLSGDGDRTSKDPYFVGRYLVDLQFLDGRLGIFTEGTWSLSRALNAYSFFPDTAQTTLPSDPIHYLVANGKTTIVKSSVVVGQKLQLWATASRWSSTVLTGPSRRRLRRTLRSPHTNMTARCGPWQSVYRHWSSRRSAAHSTP